MSDNSIANFKNIGRSPATIILFFMNVMVFILITKLPNTREILLLDPQNVTQAPWTLISVFFSQENFFHLLVNMGLLLIFGIELEKVVGGRHVFIIYFLCGLIGSLVIIPFASIIHWTGPVAGASAATFGMTAAFAAINPNKIILKGKVMQWALSLFIINIVIYFLNPAVSISAPAHALGIIVGFIYGKKSNLR